MFIKKIIIATILLTSISSFASMSALVGLASMDITPETDELIPLGGYGSMERRDWLNFFRRRPHWRMFRVSQGVLDPIRAKVMYVKNSSEKQLLFVSLDVIGVTKEMHRDLIEKLKDVGFDSASVIVSGTHTHSGPGALSPNPVWQIIGMDRFQKEYYQHFLAQVVETVRMAMANAEPSELFTLSFDTENLVHNRRGSDRPIYNNANLLLAKSTSGEWRGGLVNFAVHGTWHDANNLFFSSDVPGAIEKSLEEMLIEKNGLVRLSSNPSFLFMNGAEGDISPHLEYHDLGLSFAEQTESHWDEMKELQPVWSVVQQEVEMGKPKINIGKCVKQSWFPKNINVGLKRWVGTKTIISQVHFGDLWILTWPGEPTTELGMRLREEAQKNGASSAWVLGLTNDHMAYFLTPEEFQTGGYEACTNFFGQNGGLKIIEAHKEMFKQF
jgi:hypothetical protein